MKNYPIIPIIILLILAVWSCTLTAQDYPIHVAPQATSCAENSDVDVVNCTDNLIWDILLTEVDSTVCNPIDTSYHYNLKLDFNKKGKSTYINVTSWDDQRSGCLAYFKEKAIKISDEIEFNPALDRKNKPIVGSKYFDFTYPIPERLDSLRHAGTNWIALEQLPRFVGCEHIIGSSADIRRCSDGVMLQFMHENLEFPKKARKERVQGRVYAQFIVEPDGMLTDINIVRDIGAGCGEEVVKLVNKMNELQPPFVSGKQLGKAVKVLYTLPVTFQLEK